MNLFTERGINYSVFFFSLFWGGFVSIYFGKDISWDVVNYHYYNAYAFWHDRTHIDFWSVFFLQRFHNPLIELPGYFFIQFFSPMLATFSIGAIHGLNVWLLFLIAREFIKGDYQKSIAFFLALLGLYGPTAWLGIGSFNNDNLIALFILGAVLLHIYFFRTLCKKKLFFSMLLLGMAIGLKLTAAVFFVGMFVAFFFIPLSIRDRFVCLLIAASAFLLGLCLTSGYWMWILWQEHGNPFFPYLNDIFHSKDIPARSWRDLLMLTNWKETIFFPFYFSVKRADESGFADYRLAIVYVLFIFVLLKKMIYPRKKLFNSITHWLFVFFIASYFAWLFYFSIMRYLVALEMLAPLMIYLLVTHLLREWKQTWVLLVVIFCLVPITMVPKSIMRLRHYQGDYFNVVMPKSVKQYKKAIVVIPFYTHVFPEHHFLCVQPGYPQFLCVQPQVYLAPFFPPQWQIIGLPLVQLGERDENSLFLAKEVAEVKKRLRAYLHPIYLLVPLSTVNAGFATMEHYQKFAEQLGVKINYPCETIKSDRQYTTGHQVMLCPVQIN